jgi:hypothetical protein
MDSEGVVMMLELARGGVLCFMAVEVEGLGEEVEEECKVGEDVSERCGHDEAGVHGPGLTDNRWVFIIE